MQKLALVHETPRSDVLVAPVALGLLTVVHAVPFHWSTSVLAPAPPTATQEVVELQLTARSVADPDGAGLGITVHAMPFHSSMSGEGPAPACPTATQKDPFTHESPNKIPVVTVGVVATVQFDALTVAGVVKGAAPPGAAPRKSQAPMSAQARTGTALRTTDFTCTPLTRAPRAWTRVEVNNTWTRRRIE